MSRQKPAIKPGFIRGPKGYPIKIGGPTFNKMSKVMQQKLILEAQQGTLAQKLTEKKTKLAPNYIYSPATGKPIKIGGPAFKKLSSAQQKKALEGTGLEITKIVAKKKGPFRKTKIKRLISPKPIKTITKKPKPWIPARRLSPIRLIK